MIDKIDIRMIKVLYTNPFINVEKLSDLSYYPYTNTSTRIKKSVDNGFISYNKVKNSKQLFLTEKGVKLYKLLK